MTRASLTAPLDITRQALDAALCRRNRAFRVEIFYLVYSAELGVRAPGVAVAGFNSLVQCDSLMRTFARQIHTKLIPQCSHVPRAVASNRSRTPLWTQYKINVLAVVCIKHEFSGCRKPKYEVEATSLASHVLSTFHKIAERRWSALKPVGYRIPRNE